MSLPKIVSSLTLWKPHLNVENPFLVSHYHLYNTVLAYTSYIQKTISSLWLVDCMQPFKEDRCEIVLEDNIQVPVLKTLESLYIKQSERELNEQDMTNIIKYCCQCTMLQKVT